VENYIFRKRMQGEKLTALIVVLPLIVVVEISLQLHQALEKEM
jgi:hypothetical protein